MRFEGGVEVHQAIEDRVDDILPVDPVTVGVRQISEVAEQIEGEIRRLTKELKLLEMPDQDADA